MRFIGLIITLALVGGILIVLIVLIKRLRETGQSLRVSENLKSIGDSIATAIGIPERPVTQAVTQAEIISSGRSRAETVEFFFITNRARQLTEQDPRLSDQEAIAIAQADYSRNTLRSLGPNTTDTSVVAPTRTLADILSFGLFNSN